MTERNSNTTARLATVDQLRQTVIPIYLDPVPSRVSLRAWLDRNQVPRFKTNPLAIRGGGQVWYSVAAVEKLLRQQTMFKVSMERRAA